MAEALRKQLGIDVDLETGGRGEFIILVNDQVVAKKGWLLFPKENDAVAKVRRALQEAAPSSV